MKQTALFSALILAAAFFSSCSKQDEPVQPACSKHKSVTWISYQLAISNDDSKIPYKIEYLTDKGVQTLSPYTGSFSIRVPAMQYDSAGYTYVRTMLRYSTLGSDDGLPPVIHSGVKVSGDNGFIIVETPLNPTGCTDPARVLANSTPVEWFSVK